MICLFHGEGEFDMGDRVYAVSNNTVTRNRHAGPFVGYVFCVSAPNNVLVEVPMIAPVIVTTIKREKVVIDPIEGRRNEYRELGCTYTDAGDLAVCDYVDGAIDGVNETIDYLGEYVEALKEIVKEQGKEIERLKNPHIGSSLSEFFAEIGELELIEQKARKRTKRTKKGRKGRRR